MKENFYLQLLQQGERQEIQRVLDCNLVSSRFGLVLTEAQAMELMNSRLQNLQETGRVEFGNGVMVQLIHAFCPSPYLQQEDYVLTLARLQEIFYLYKNESLEQWSDEELIQKMKYLYDNVCQGSLDGLEESCLDALARSVRYFGERGNVDAME